MTNQNPTPSPEKKTMSKKKKIIIGVIIAIVLLLIAGQCAKTEDADNTAKNTTTSSSESAPETTQSETTESEEPSEEMTTSEDKPAPAEEDAGKAYENYIFKEMNVTSWDQIGPPMSEWATHVITVKDGGDGWLQIVTNLTDSDEGKDIAKKAANGTANILKFAQKSELPESLTKMEKVGVTDASGEKVLAQQNLEFND